MQLDDSSSIITDLLSTAQDLVDERRASKQQLAAANDDLENYRLLIDSVVDYAVFMLDPQGYVTTWNPGAQRIKGYERSEILGKHFSIFHSPEANAAGLPAHELAMAAARGRYEEEDWRIRKNGSRFWASVVVTAVHDHDGTLLGFGKVIRDLSERRAAVQTLATADANLDSFHIMIDAVVDYAVYMLDPNGIVTSWNLGAQHIKGYNPAEIIGKHFSVFYPPEAIAADLPARELYLAARDGRYAEEGWRVRKDGSRLWASVVLTALHNPDGTLIGFGKVTRDLTERREAEQALAAANVYLDSFRLMVEAVVDYAVFIHDVRGFVTTWNSGAERILGYTPAEIIGQNVSLFYPAEAAAEGLSAQELAVAIEHGHHEIEGWRVRKDGSRLWAKVTITALRSSEGALIGFGKVMRDLTEQRRADEALQESNRLKTETAANLVAANSYLRNILDASIFSAIIAADLNGTITTFNRGAELMLGYTAEEVVGKRTAEMLYVPEEIERRTQAISKLISRPLNSRVEMFLQCQQEHGPTEWTFVRKDGQHLTVNLSVSLILGEDGQQIGAMGVARDVTQERNDAQEISAAYTQLNSVLEYTSDCIMNIGPDWTITYCNRRAQETIADLKVGKSYWDCFPDVIGTSVEQSLRTALERRTEVFYEVFYEPYSEWFRGRIFPTDSGISVFFSNVTEEKKMQEQLALEQVLREKRIEALSHMAGGLAHEISNPLAIIHARASDLKTLAFEEQSISTTEVGKACDSILKTADRASRILRGLKGFGREAGNDPMAWASPYEIIEESYDVQHSRCERHHVQLDLILAPDLPLLLCRETQIGQIVTNLLNNAFDAIHQSNSTERWIKVTAENLVNAISIKVTDSGPGIEEKFRPHLMDPFFTTKTLGLGMGVGLSLSRAIAQDHGGSLNLLADTLNTCFELILPVDPVANSHSKL